MDSRMKLCFFAFVVLGSLSVVSAQVECYDCNYDYNDGETESDPNDCKTPSSSTMNATCGATMKCYVQSEITSSLGLFGGGRIRYSRGCMEDDACQANDCRKTPRDCISCCNGDFCNTASLNTHLVDNMLTRPCYRCQYSDIRGTRSDARCGPSDFDADASDSQVYSVDCPGLCYIARAKYEHAVEIIRGCQYHGSYCTYDRQAVNGVPANEFGDSNYNAQHQYELSCCVDDNCNTATALSVGLMTILFSATLGVFVI
ncbi:uncharacterized protein LOC121406909 [Lytechinus variegatus]|uniref:uncharacterized protein LOC121406909 n=1 Tax=Lytechinus variegatus TaxID=7654 RepID=UPI001BB2CD10|nr:uncharacterized protein LOC121406909 [Lytechinus variegatus]